MSSSGVHHPEKGHVSRRGVLGRGLAGAFLGLAAPSLSGCAAPAIVAVTGGVDPERTAAYRTLALRAIPVVEDLWGTDTVPLPVRLDLPATLTAWSAATGHKPDKQGYAASTVRLAASARGGAMTRGTADENSDDVRIVMHPDAWVELGPEGRLGVIVHEVTHLVMGTGEGAPWWLGEGLAEYTAHRTSARSLEQIAGSAWGPIVGTPPTSWPTENAQQPWQGYASAWLACVFIAETAGEEALLALYNRVCAGRALDRACRDVLGRGESDLRQDWSRWLSEQ